MTRCEVDPNDLRFTQDSIAVKFKPPHDSTRIDDAVDKIRSGEWSASTFPSITVVEVDGVLFSLDNRRLWVFRKAKLSSITVKLQDKCWAHPRVQGLEDNPTLTESMKCRRFFPKVRAKNVKQHWPASAKAQARQRPQAVPYEYAWQQTLTNNINNFSTDATLANIKQETSVQNTKPATMEAHHARQVATETPSQKIWTGLQKLWSYFTE